MSPTQRAQEPFLALKGPIQARDTLPGQSRTDQQHPRGTWLCQGVPALALVAPAMALAAPAVALVAPEGLCHQQRSSQALRCPAPPAMPSSISLQGKAQGWLSEERSSGEEEQGCVRKAPEEQSCCSALP